MGRQNEWEIEKPLRAEPGLKGQWVRGADEEFHAVVRQFFDGYAFEASRVEKMVLRNRLMRQYFPKGTDLSVHTQEHIDSVACELNDRPKKTLNYFSPAENFEECVASIG